MFKKPTVSKDGDKKITELEESRKAEIGKAMKEYEKEHGSLMKKYGEEEKSRLDFWNKKKTDENMEDPKFWILTNAGALRDFIKYGANKVMDQIRVRTHAKIEAREEIDKLKKQQKQGIDAKQVAFTLLIIGVVGVLAYVIITNFLNYQAMANDNIQLKRIIGDRTGDLAVCTRQLRQFIPDAFPETPAANNTLEG